MLYFKKRLKFFIFSLLFLFFSPHAKAIKAITIGIIQDGNSTTLDEYRNFFKKEMSLLAKDSEYSVEFLEYSSHWNLASIEENLKLLLQEKKVDYIFLNGYLASKLAAKEDLELTKPVITSTIFKSELNKTLYDNEQKSSLKKNYNFVKSPQSFEREIEIFQELVKFKTLHLIVDSAFLKIDKNIQRGIIEFNKNNEIKLELITYEDDYKKLINKIHSINDIEAVYLSPMPRYSLFEKSEIINSINKKKIPSFSGHGLADIEIGALLTISPELDERLIKRACLNIHQLVILEKDLGELVIFMPIEERLSLNAQTARQIGYYPDFKTELTANIINKDSLREIDSLETDHEELDLAKTISLAKETNIDIEITYEELKQSKSFKNSSFTEMLPQVNLRADFDWIEEDRAKATNGAVPKSATGLGADARQMIFDDQIITDFRRARKDFQAQEFAYQLKQFDIMALSANRFLEYLAQLNILKIKIQNFNLVQSNLDLAKSRYQVGMGGREEVFRWEAERANSKSQVLEEEAKTNQALVKLNQTLNQNQNKRWDLMTEIDRPEYYLFYEDVKKQINNRQILNILKKFLVEQAYKNSPELASLDKKIQAQKMKVNQSTRRFILPKVFAEFGYTWLAQQDRTEGIFSEERAEADEQQFNFNISADYPIFEGGGKYFDLKIEEAIYKRLLAEREKARQLIEQEVLANIYSLTSSAPNIYLSELAAENAIKNLEVIRDKYARGDIDIITLIDAQNQSLIQGQKAAIANFQYMNDLINLQRAISWFASTKSSEEKEKFNRDFEEMKKEILNENT